MTFIYKWVMGIVLLLNPANIFAQDTALDSLELMMGQNLSYMYSVASPSQSGPRISIHLGDKTPLPAHWKNSPAIVTRLLFELAYGPFGYSSNLTLHEMFPRGASALYISYGSEMEPELWSELLQQDEIEEWNIYFGTRDSTQIPDINE
jgi:hypothetical protein